MILDSSLNSELQQRTAGAQALGFDYQFYYFMFLALNLKLGQKIGFEVKDDIHIDKEDGNSILFQSKHTVLKTVNGTAQNLTTLDVDLWKTLSNWSTFINTDTTTDFLDKHSFILVTNKSDNNNDFISSLNQFKTDKQIDNMLTKINELKNKTQDNTLKQYFKNVASLGKLRLKKFFMKLTVETEVDEIIQKIKNRILENIRQENLVDSIFDSLCSNLQIAKYTDIKDRNKFEISCEDFNKKFGKCFKVATELKPLPKRDFPILLPENLENQAFIKQLLDIGEIETESDDIRNFTTQMLKFINHFTYWSEEENFILLTDIEDFKNNSIQIWKNEFRSKYRQITNQISSGKAIDDLEDDIKLLGIELVDFIRQQDLSINGYSPLGIEFSNGHYYVLSDNLEIGWHFDWKNKYKKE